MCIQQFGSNGTARTWNLNNSEEQSAYRKLFWVSHKEQHNYDLHERIVAMLPAPMRMQSFCLQHLWATSWKPLATWGVNVLCTGGARSERAALVSSPHCRDLTRSSPQTANSSASTDVRSKGAVPSEATLELSENSPGVPAAARHILVRKPFGQCKPIYLHLVMPNIAVYLHARIYVQYYTHTYIYILCVIFIFIYICLYVSLSPHLFIVIYI
jgi:hypothetical protein